MIEWMDFTKNRAVRSHFDKIIGRLFRPKFTSRLDSVHVATETLDWLGQKGVVELVDIVDAHGTGCTEIDETYLQS